MKIYMKIFKACQILKNLQVEFQGVFKYENLQVKF